MTTYILTMTRGYLSAYRGLSIPAWHGLLLCLIEALLIGIYYFLPLYFINELQVDVTTAGVMISFYGIGTIIGGYLGGKLADRFSPGKIALISLLLQTIVFFCLLQVQNWYLLDAILMVMGVASYMFVTANHLWVLNHCTDEQQRLQAISLLSVAANLGLALSAIVIGFFLTDGFHHIFVASLCCLLLAVAYAAWLALRYDGVLRQDSIQEESDTDMHPVSRDASYSGMMVGLVLAIVFFVGVIIAQANTTYSLYVKDAFPDFGIRGVSFLFLLNCVMVVLLQAPLTTLMADKNKLGAIGIGAGLAGLSMALLPLSPVFGVVALGMVLHTFGEMIFFAPAQFVCYQNAQATHRGRRIGLYRTVYAASRVFGPVIGGFIYQQFSGDTLWYGCGVLGALALLICFYAKQQFMSLHVGAAKLSSSC